jgi:uncharacterized glyoxalase superfamily protein PhnB
MTVLELFPYLCVRDAAGAIEFYARAFGGEETLRLVEPGGRIGHAEVALGGRTLMLSEEYPEMGVRAPDPGRGVPFVVHLHVDDADRVIERALAAGATLVRGPKDEFYGERSGRIRDPFGHEWLIGHSIEELSAEEMQRRYEALFR